MSFEWYGMPIRLATSNMPPTPTVVLIASRASVFAASRGCACSTSLAKITGPLRFCRKSWTDGCIGGGTRGPIALRHRDQDHVVDHLVEPENRAVHLLKRIVELDFGRLVRGGAGSGARGGATDQRQADGGNGGNDQGNGGKRA